MFNSADKDVIHELPARYARCVDRRDFDKLRDLFAHDAVVAAFPGDPATTEPLYRLAGIDSIKQAFELLRQYQSTFHLVGQQLVEALNANEAHGETYCIAYHFHSKGEWSYSYVMYIRYLDHFVKIDDQWKIKTRALIVDRTEGQDIEH